MLISSCLVWEVIKSHHFIRFTVIDGHRVANNGRSMLRGDDGARNDGLWWELSTRRWSHTPKVDVWTTWWGCGISFSAMRHCWTSITAQQRSYFERLGRQEVRRGCMMYSGGENPPVQLKKVLKYCWAGTLLHSSAIAAQHWSWGVGCVESGRNTISTLLNAPATSENGFDGKNCISPGCDALHRTRRANWSPTAADRDIHA